MTTFTTYGKLSNGNFKIMTTITINNKKYDVILEQDEDGFDFIKVNNNILEEIDTIEEAVEHLLEKYLGRIKAEGEVDKGETEDGLHYADVSYSTAYYDIKDDSIRVDWRHITNANISEDSYEYAVDVCSDGIYCTEYLQSLCEDAVYDFERSIEQKSEGI